MKLGYLVSPRTVRKYMRRPWSGRPSPGWKVFLKKHARNLWACDFLCVRTLSFRTLYVFFVIQHASREIVHMHATAHPTAVWVAQQLVNACYDRDPPRYLIRDRDGIYGLEFTRKVRNLGLQQIRTPVRAPKTNAIAERFAGTLRWECLDHVLIFNERHLQKTVVEFAAYYNRYRPHRSLALRPPCAPSSVSMRPTAEQGITVTVHLGYTLRMTSFLQPVLRFFRTIHQASAYFVIYWLGIRK